MEQFNKQSTSSTRYSTGTCTQSLCEALIPPPPITILNIGMFCYLMKKNPQLFHNSLILFTIVLASIAMLLEIFIATTSPDFVFVTLLLGPVA